MTGAVRKMLAAWESGDWSGGTQLLSDDVHFSAAQPEGQREATGPAGIAAFMREFLQGWEHYRIDFHDLEVLGEDRCLAVATQHGKARASGIDITAPAFIAIAFTGDRISTLEWYLHRGEALAALGMPEVGI